MEKVTCRGVYVCVRAENRNAAGPHSSRHFPACLGMVHLQPRFSQECQYWLPASTHTGKQLQHSRCPSLYTHPSIYPSIHPSVHPSAFVFFSVQFSALYLPDYTTKPG